MTSSSEYGGFYGGPRGGGRGKGKTEPLGGVSLPTLGGGKPGGPNTTAPGAFGRGPSSRSNPRGNSRGNSRGGVNSRGGLFDRDQLPRTPSRRMAAARARAQGGQDTRVGNGMPGSRGRRQPAVGLSGFDWAQRDRDSRSRGRNAGEATSENDWRRKTMHLNNGLPNGLTNGVQPGAERTVDASPRKTGPATKENGVFIGAKSIGGKYPPGMFFGGGGKKENQDDMFFHMAENGDFVAAALDGHGLNGKTVSNYCKRKLSEKLASTVGINGRAAEPEEMEKRLTDGVLGTSNDLIATSIDALDSGTTLVTAVKRGNELWCANVGDSRAVLARESTGRGGSTQLRPVELSRDHKPNDREEMARVKQMGGQVEPSRAGMHGAYMGPHRVWVRKQQEGGLAMARSLGDLRLQRVGVIADPEIKRFQLNKDTDKFVVLASDGVWDHLDNQRVIDIAKRYIDQSAGKAAAAVSDAARKQWGIQGGGYVDDITTVVVKLQPEGME